MQSKQRGRPSLRMRELLVLGRGTGMHGAWGRRAGTEIQQSTAEWGEEGETPRKKDLVRLGMVEQGICLVSDHAEVVRVEFVKGKEESGE
jgi:hypothetical protein